VPVLKEISLNDSDPRLRQAALSVLAALNVEHAVEVANVLMGEADPALREQAVQAAGRMPDPRAAKIMSRALDDEDANIRAYAAGAPVPASAREDVIPKLKTLLDDPDARVRRHARRSLLDLTGVDYGETDSR
jgi:hypothetical protein